MGYLYLRVLRLRRARYAVSVLVITQPNDNTQTENSTRTRVAAGDLVLVLRVVRVVQHERERGERKSLSRMRVVPCDATRRQGAQLYRLRREASKEGQVHNFKKVP